MLGAAGAVRIGPLHRQEIRQGGVHLLGTSGTVTTLAGVALGLPRYRRPLVDGAVLSGAEADAAGALLQSLGREGLHRHPCVGPERADFVLPGCAVFAAIRLIWPAPSVVVADRGLREGMLLRMMRGNGAPAARRGTFQCDGRARVKKKRRPDCAAPGCRGSPRRRCAPPWGGRRPPNAG